MKKLIALLLALIMVFGLVACGAKQEEAPAEEAAPPVEEAPPAEEAPAEEPAEEAPAEKQSLRIAVLVGSSEDKADDSPYLA